MTKICWQKKILRLLFPMLQAFLLLHLTVNASLANNLACEQTFSKTQSKTFLEAQKLAQLVSNEELANQFNYSISNLDRLFRHRPQIYVEMVKIHLGKKSRYTAEDLKAVDLYRGIVDSPEDYDPLFTSNQFGGTHSGINWFSKDSSVAHGYAKPTREQAIEKKYETKKSVVPMGMLIHFQIPKFIIEEARTNDFKNKNLSLDRKYLKNESLYIDSIVLINADFKINDFTDKEITYETFLKEFLKRSRFKTNFIF